MELSQSERKKDTNVIEDANAAGNTSNKRRRKGENDDSVSAVKVKQEPTNNNLMFSQAIMDAIKKQPAMYVSSFGNSNKNAEIVSVQVEEQETVVKTEENTDTDGDESEDEGDCDEEEVVESAKRRKLESSSSTSLLPSSAAAPSSSSSSTSSTYFSSPSSLTRERPSFDQPLPSPPPILNSRLELVKNHDGSTFTVKNEKTGLTESVIVLRNVDGDGGKSIAQYIEKVWEYAGLPVGGPEVDSNDSKIFSEEKVFEGICDRCEEGTRVTCRHALMRGAAQGDEKGDKFKRLFDSTAPRRWSAKAGEDLVGALEPFRLKAFEYAEHALRNHVDSEKRYLSTALESNNLFRPHPSPGGQDGPEVSLRVLQYKPFMRGSGKFHPHLDTQGMSWVMLLNLGVSCDFVVDKEGDCKKFKSTPGLCMHYRILSNFYEQTGEVYKSACDTCIPITLNSGDILLFNADTASKVVHGVKKIHKLQKDQSIEGLPQWCNQDRISLQMRVESCAENSRKKGRAKDLRQLLRKESKKAVVKKMKQRIEESGDYLSI